MANSNQKKYLNITEASEFLSVSKASLRRWTNTGRLKCYRVGERSERRFDLNDLIALMDTPQEPAAIAQIGDETNSPMTHEHRHICTFFKNPREQWQLIKKQFIEHTEDDARIIYIYHGDLDRILHWLNSEQINTKKLNDEQTITLLSTTESYHPNGVFDIEHMLTFWKKLITEAEQQGIKKLLLTGEMGWVNNNIPGREQLIPYEAALDYMLESYPWVTVICQYPIYQISGVTVFDTLCSHSHVQLSDRLAPGFCS